jgi:hypothetical protein
MVAGWCQHHVEERISILLRGIGDIAGHGVYV